MFKIVIVAKTPETAEQMLRALDKCSRAISQEPCYRLESGKKWVFTPVFEECFVIQLYAPYLSQYTFLVLRERLERQLGSPITIECDSMGYIICPFIPHEYLI